MSLSKGVTPQAGSGCHPTASAAEEASSRSGIPNADDEFAGKSLGQLAEFMAATATLIEITAANVARQQVRCQQEREFLCNITELYERLSQYVSGKARAALEVAQSERTGE